MTLHPNRPRSGLGSSHPPSIAEIGETPFRTVPAQVYGEIAKSRQFCDKSSAGVSQYGLNPRAGFRVLKGSFLQGTCHTGDGNLSEAFSLKLCPLPQLLQAGSRPRLWRSLGFALPWNLLRINNLPPNGWRCRSLDRHYNPLGL